MPKQRRTQPSRPVKKKPAAKTQAKARPQAKGTPGKAKPPARAVRRPAPAPGKATKRPAPRKLPSRGRSVVAAAKMVVAVGPSSHDQAVERFERGFQALQQRQFSRAAALLSEVVSGYPDEKELQERARVYLSICERQKASQAPSPRSLEERVNAATVAINRGAFTEALTLLRKLQADHGDNDYVQYMLSVVYTVLGDFPHALEHLKHAVALNHENRFLATHDADLDSLRQDPGFSGVLDTHPARPKAVARRR
jgi:tetratricopeptide (TPR) repeat protein